MRAHLRLHHAFRQHALFHASATGWPRGRFPHVYRGTQPVGSGGHLRGAAGACARTHLDGRRLGADQVRQARKMIFVLKKL